jgi:hypothetical protein
MEKLSEEQMDAIFNCTDLDEYHRPYFKHRLREAGYGVSAETLLEKARKLWEEWKCKLPSCPIDTGVGECFRRATNYIDALTAEIDRLKSEAWTNELVDEYARYRHEQFLNHRPFVIARDWFVARRAAKAKE